MNARSARTLLAFCFAAVAPVAVTGQDAPSAYDRVWRYAEWYVNDENPVVQSVRFSGRFQYEFATVSDDPASHDEWNVRRLRAGIRSIMFRRLTVHVEGEFNPQERDPFYMRLTDSYLEWAQSSTLAVTVGKQGVPFTMDGSTSSRELLTIDRSNLANNMWFPQEYMPGVSVSGEPSGWVYQVGVFSAGAADRELGDFSGSYFTHALLGYQAAEALGIDRALIRANWVYQDADPSNTFTRQLEHVGSLNADLRQGRLGVRTDVTAAKGYLGQSDLWGAMLMPTFDATPALQLVTRYTHVVSSDPNGVRLNRYESELTSGRGDRYDELYLGANYYFYAHRLKLQAGAQWADMRDEAADGGDYSGVAATVGLRVGW